MRRRKITPSEAIGNNITRNEGIKSYAFNSMKFYASKLVRNGFYSIYDLDDLEQEILALFYCRIGKYRHDAEKSTEKYWINMIMEGIYGNLKKKAQKRNELFSKTSLNDFSNPNSLGMDSDSTEKEIIEFMEDKNPNSNTFEIYYQERKQEKIIKLIESLPEDLKELCRYLQKGDENITEIAKKLNTSRKTIYQKYTR